MKKISCLLLIQSCLLLGCMPPRQTSDVTAQTITQDRRSTEIIASDKTIEQEALATFYDDAELMNQSHINVNSYNGLVLLTGEATNEVVKARVLDIVRTIPHVKLVRDNIVIDMLSSASSRISDEQLTQQIKQALTQIYTLPNFNSEMVKVVSENGTVYLMGMLTKEEGNVVINVTRLQPGVRQIVTVFEYLN